MVPDIDKLIADHERLISDLQAIRHAHPNSPCVEMPFHPTYRADIGEKPTPAQTAINGWRDGFGFIMKRLRGYFTDSARSTQIERYPLSSTDLFNFGYSYTAENTIAVLQDHKSHLSREKEFALQLPERRVEPSSGGFVPIHWRADAFGEKLKRARLEFGHGQKEAAERCWAPLETYKKWERGRPPHASKLDGVLRYMSTGKQES